MVVHTTGVVLGVRGPQRECHGQRVTVGWDQTNWVLNIALNIQRILTVPGEAGKIRGLAQLCQEDVQSRSMGEEGWEKAGPREEFPGLVSPLD
jgi:hypothetical protein